MGRNTGSGRAFALAAGGLCLLAVACQQPVVGELATVAAPTEGPLVVIEDGWLDLNGKAVATFSVTQDGVPLAAAEVLALAPRFTLARLTDHPAGDDQRAWQSLVLTGAHVAPTLRPGGPDDPNVVSQRQPGYEAATSLVELGEGRYRYVFASAFPGFSPDETLRIGLWLSGVAHGHASLRTSTTYDFRPSGGPVEARDTVLDANCVDCHGAAVVEHETAAGVRLCATCHTWQNVDIRTIDPAAIVGAGTTTATNPNPLELGRLLHRVHRGKDLPTLYQTAWDGVSLTSTQVPFAPNFAPPFVQQKPGSPARAILPGRKFSVVAEDGREKMFAQSFILSSFDPTLGSTMLLASGGLFPRDLRDCAACHRDAPQGWVVRYGISRRTCSGCHPEVWYRDTSPAADRARYPHPGGPQADDTRCQDCHVTGAQKLYASLDEVHVVPARAPRYNMPVVEIVRVDDLAPGKRPKVTFRLSDRVGPIAPSPSAPVPAYDPDPASSSFVPRRFAANSIVIKILGPAETDYAGANVQLNSGAASGNPDPSTLTTSSYSDEYVYTFSSVVPPGATGTFIVGFEARRFFTPPSASPYDKNRDLFLWPYTGETVNETAENTHVYVSSASGTWTKASGSPGAVPRRTIVDTDKCLRCHDRIEFHSSARHHPAWCVTCHQPEATDLPQRVNVAGRLYPGGPVRIGATFDGVEERSSHFKMHMHRLHTGAREGVASLEAIKPFALYFSKAYFFDRGGYPGDLRNCTMCHAGRSYHVDSVPADAPPTRANEQATITHWTGTAARGGDSGGIGILHDPDEPSVLPVTAACTGCHATSATFSHVEAKTVNGVETCAQCHVKGNLSVDVAHGLASPSGIVSASFAAIASEILEPRCASTACHARGATPPVLEASSAYQALVGVQSGQSSLKHVEPFDVQKSYLVHKLRGTATSVGGAVGTIMPTDGALPPADIAAIEAWIANGAPND